MLDPADPRRLDTLLRRHRITLKHRLGQNFLIDSALRDRIADASGVNSDEEVLEVGAGVGALTIALASRARRVVAVELDDFLIPALREVVGDIPNVEIVKGDILRLDVTGEVVAGNIPYNLTGALIRKLLDHPPRPKRLSLVVQKEVAERWTAETSASLSTVAVQVLTIPTLAFTVPASAFRPAPRVDSALVVLEVRPAPAVSVGDLGAFFRFVEAVFQFRRKQLGGILTRLGIGKEVLNDVGLDSTLRPQSLTLRDWENLFRAVNPGLDR